MRRLTRKILEVDLSNSLSTPQSSAISPDLAARLKKIKLFLCDVDGILTDSSVFIGLPDEIKRFHVRDGLGLMLLRDCNIKVGWVSRRPSTATTRRAQELKVDFLEQIHGSKVEAVESLLERNSFAWEEICYMGDDIVDLGVMHRAGVAATVADATEEAKAAAHYVATAGGGMGGVREVVELILKAQGHWEMLVAKNAA